jgi:hypothetical protein
VINFINRGFENITSNINERCNYQWSKWLIITLEKPTMHCNSELITITYLNPGEFNHAINKGSHNTNLKGTVVWDFFLKWFCQKYPTGPLICENQFWIQTILVKYSSFRVLPRFGPLGWIWLCAMGHYSKFGFTLWATAANLVTCYGPLWWIWLCTMGHCAERSCTIKFCNDFHTTGHSTRFGYVL